MTDYKKLGLKCGLEVHQQLDVGKLFCRCPSKMREDKADIIFRRKLHPVPSELGEYDAAAIEAFKKNLTYIYEAYSDSTCLVEADEEPPRPINKEALETVLKVALMSEANILDELYVMRKTVIDGSNTSGFQRTMLVAHGGKIKLKEKSIGLQALVLEEDAGRPIKKTEQEIVYRLDRLGIPLIEIATEPEIFSPDEAKQAALALGEMLRRTCKAKRGLGTIRQDLNVSIAEGARVEVKGVQELPLVGEYVKREVERQEKLLEIKNELKKRGLKKEALKNESVNLSSVFGNTECKFFSSGLKEGKAILGVKLAKFNGIIGRELQPGRRFGTEVANYTKSRANVAGILHSDELPKYGISESEVSEVRKKLGCSVEDAFVLVCEKEAKAKNAVEVVLSRCKLALECVPEETRNALGDGNTEYSRPLPGAARMYPETDIETIIIEKKQLDALRKKLPLTVEERLKLYKKHGLSDKLADKIKLSNHACFFEELLEKKYNATKTAVLLIEGIVNLKRTGVNTENITNEMIEAVLDAEKGGKITQDVLVNVLGEWSRNPSAAFEDVISGMNIEAKDDTEIRKVIAGIISKNRDFIAKKGAIAEKALMGDVMKELRGKASGGLVSRILHEEIEKVLK